MDGGSEIRRRDDRAIVLRTENIHDSKARYCSSSPELSSKDKSSECQFHSTRALITREQLHIGAHMPN